ncbi:c-type cytochrome [Hymenobacter qilianensis]|nr:cytochrome c [Hymenobacter qilianensis]
MRKALLAGIFPVGIALLVCTLGVLFLSAAGLLYEPNDAAFTVDNSTEVAALDSIVVTEYGVMRVTSEGLERVPDSIALAYLPASDPLMENLSEADAAAVAVGDKLFKANCVQCHTINEVVVGPALKDIHERRPISWLISWIQNSSKMVAAGDAYAVKIYNQYQKQEMPSFALTDAEVTQLVKYIEIESMKSSVVYCSQ